MSRIDQTFARLRAGGRKALIPYLMAGDPSLQETEELVLALERAGADIIELGVPFSDPIADGPVIQKAAERALAAGASLKRILETVASLRRRTQVPLVLMAYYNSIHAFGERAFCRAACDAGVDGLIVPDLPPEEAGHLCAEAAAGPDIIFLVAPTSTPARRALIAKHSRSFIYYVSLTGTTGAKLATLGDITANVAKIRSTTTTPVAVGFGISTAEEAGAVAEVADGVVVGSAIVRQVEQHRHDPGLSGHVERFVGTLRAALGAERMTAPV